MPLPRWIAPKNPRRVWILLGVGALLITWQLLSAQGFLNWNPRLRDKAGALTKDDQRKLDAVLGWLYEENRVDVHIELLPDVGNDVLEHYSVRRMRELGIGRESGRRGILVVYDRSSGRIRMEVGPALEGILPDIFVGRINRDIFGQHVAAKDVRSGLYATLFMVLGRLRQAALGGDFDPRVFTFVDDTRRLSLGAGQTTRVDSNGPGAVLGKRRATPAEREYFAAQPTVKAAYELYQRWLAYGGEPHDVPLFTLASVDWWDETPITPAYARMSLMQEYGRAYRIEERGKVAMLFFTNDPFAQPHFFRRGRDGWQVDIVGEVLNTRNTIGGRYSWILWQSGDDFFRAFRERFVEYNGVLRLAGADNREIPMSMDDSSRGVHEPLPIARSDSIMEHLTIVEAADRIRAHRGTPTLVILYGTWSELERTWLPTLVALADSSEAAGVKVLAFSTDQVEQALLDLPGLLRESKGFPAVHIYDWWPGMLDSTMATLGIHIGVTWDAPVIALLDRDGKVLTQSQRRIPSASTILRASGTSGQR